MINYIGLGTVHGRLSYSNLVCIYIIMYIIICIASDETRSLDDKLHMCDVGFVSSIVYACHLNSVICHLPLKFQCASPQ